MPLIVAIAPFPEIKSVGLVYIHPYRRCVALPDVHTGIVATILNRPAFAPIVPNMPPKPWRRLIANVVGELSANWLSIVSRLAHHNHVIRYAHTAHGAVFLDGFVQ